MHEKSRHKYRGPLLCLQANAACGRPEAQAATSTPYGAHMDIGQYGDLNSLHWVENELDPEPNMVLCEVMYGESVVSTVKF